MPRRTKPRGRTVDLSGRPRVFTMGDANALADLLNRLDAPCRITPGARLRLRLMAEDMVALGQWVKAQPWG